MSDHSIIQSIKVVDANDVEKPITYGSKVKLQAGAGFQIVADPSSSEITLSADLTAAASDPFYQAKFNDLQNGGSGFGYSFTGGPWYISAINKTPPSSEGNYMLVGSACAQVGLFDDMTIINNEPVEARPSSLESQLDLLDICEADVDCSDYQRLFDYLERIKTFMDANKDNNISDGTQLFKQYQATVEYWNYQVNRLSLIFEVRASPGLAVVQIGYVNMGCETLGCTSIGGSSSTSEADCIEMWYEVTKLPTDSPPVRTHSFIEYSHGELASDIVYAEIAIPNGISYSTLGQLRPKEWIAFSSAVVFPVDEVDSSSTSSDSDPDGDLFLVTAYWVGTHLGSISLSRTIRIPNE